MNVLKGDKRLVIAAAGTAQRAADWILGKRPESDVTATGDVPVIVPPVIPTDANTFDAEAFALPA